MNLHIMIQFTLALGVKIKVGSLSQRTWKTTSHLLIETWHNESILWLFGSSWCCGPNWLGIFLPFSEMKQKWTSISMNHQSRSTMLFLEVFKTIRSPTLFLSSFCYMNYKRNIKEKQGLNLIARNTVGAHGCLQKADNFWKGRTWSIILRFT